MSAAECESAALGLGLSDFSATTITSFHSHEYPPFCHIFGGMLYFSTANTGPCSTFAKCVCRLKNSRCSADMPCGEGQDNCDDDIECEGSLVCGHMNCVNSTITDCCTRPCEIDSDCQTSGECDVEDKQCRLNSDTIDWSRCSHDSPCTSGEGDCDLHTDCEGTLLCGNDNCANGSREMDCCFGSYLKLYLAPLLDIVFNFTFVCRRMPSKAIGQPQGKLDQCFSTPAMDLQYI